MDLGAISSNVGWIAVAIAVAGWWISDSIDDLVSAYRETQERHEIEDDQ